MGKIALHRMALNYKDRLAQQRFHTKHLGFKRVKVFNPGKPNEFVMLRARQTRLELFSIPSNEFSEAGRPVGFMHMCFEVDDVASKLRLMRGEVTVTWEIEDRNDQMPGLIICFFKDLKTNCIELLQGWQDEDLIRPTHRYQVFERIMREADLPLVECVWTPLHQEEDRL